MDVQQKLDARKAFKLRVHEASGIAFEDLFCDIMRASNSDFKKVKPQGRIGDRKNDGFIPSKGKYFQVYAPQSPIGNPSSAKTKLKEDLAGLLSYWRDEHGYTVSQFYFVFNDKYHGAYPEIYTTLKHLKDRFNLHTCEVFLSSELEDA
jgi:hypothetical protein